MELKKILVVDDDPAIQEVVKIVLEDANFAVVLASSIAEVRKALTNHEISLVLLDLRLGQEDGLVCAKEIKNHFPSLPIILTTAGTGLDALVKKAGAVAAIAKPFDIDYLVETINLHLPKP